MAYYLHYPKIKCSVCDRNEEIDPHSYLSIAQTFCICMRCYKKYRIGDMTKEQLLKNVKKLNFYDKLLRNKNVKQYNK